MHVHHALLQAYLKVQDLLVPVPADLPSLHRGASIAAMAVIVHLASLTSYICLLQA